MTRTSRRLALAGLAVLLLSACGNGEVGPGSAAAVGEQRITTDRLEEMVEQTVALPAAQQLASDPMALQGRVLGRLINRELLEQAAEREGISVTDGDVEAELQVLIETNGGREALEELAAEQGISPQDFPSVVRDGLYQQGLADVLTEDVDVPREDLQAAYEQRISLYDQVKVRHILVPDEATARSLLDQVRADPDSFGRLAAEFSTDPGSKDSGGELPLAGRGTYVAPFEQALDETAPGGFAIAKTDFGWHVLQVQDRQVTSVAEAEPQLRRTLLDEQRGEAVGEYVRGVAGDVGVSVNPRFGRWDAEAGAVVASEPADGALTPAPEPGVEEQAPEPGAPAPGASAPSE